MSWAAVTLSVAVEVCVLAVLVMVEGVDPPRTQNAVQLTGTQRQLRCRRGGQPPVPATPSTVCESRTSSLGGALFLDKGRDPHGEANDDDRFAQRCCSPTTQRTVSSVK